MNRLAGLAWGAGLAIGLSAAAVAAPPVLDRVPTDALVVISTPSIDRLNKGVQTLTTGGSLPIPMGNIKDLMAMGGLEKGIDTTRSIALAILPAAKPAADAKDTKKKEADGDADDAPPPMVVLIPVTDYKELLSNFTAETAGPGIDSVTIQGDKAFLRNLGDGYAAMSPQKDVIEKFAGKGGNMKAHEAALGKTCGAIADGSDFVVIANIPAIKAMPGPSVTERMKSAMEDRMAMMGGPAPDMAGMEAMVTMIMEQTRIGVMGVRIDGAGVSVDAGAQFIEGSQLAKSFGVAGKSSDLLKKLPKQDFIIAFAADLSNATIKDAFKKANPLANMPGGDKNEAMKMMSGQAEKVDGVAMSMGMSPGALMGGGLFSSTVGYLQTKDPAGYLATAQKAFTELNGKKIEGTEFTTSYTANASKVNEVPIDAWEIKLNMDEDSPMPPQAMGMLFGPAGGPAGYFAKADGAVITTLSKNSVLMSAALDAQKGTNAMGGDEMTSQVTEKLPPGRFFEGYLGIKSLLDMAKPMIAMMGGGAEPEIPDVIPPIALGVAGSGDGSGRTTLFVPMPVIKAVASIAKSMQEANEPQKPPPPGKGTGQPKF